jgi:6-phosphogluconate dehydrogenase
MNIGMVGLGKMGLNMSTRLIKGGHHVVAFDLTEDAIAEAESAGAKGVHSLQEMVEALSPPRAIWVMVPAGAPVEKTLTALGKLMESGDVIIDGGNSNYKNSLRLGDLLEKDGIALVDVGTSGGIWGISEGYSMMVGGSKEAVEQVRPALETLAPTPKTGWGYVGPRGAGHFVKMVHNGIEYGMMRAYGEGFEILETKDEFDIDLHQVAEIWRYGSVIRSWLLDLTADALADDAKLASIEDWVDDSGEGRWTVFEAIQENVPAPVITLALQMRLVSRQSESFASKVVAALRREFGGHKVKKAEESGDDA